MQDYASRLHLLLGARDQAEATQERFRLALITSDPAKWLHVFFPEAVSDKKEVSEEDLEEDEGITFEFEDMDADVAEDLLAQVMAMNKQGSLSSTEDGAWR